MRKPKKVFVYPLHFHQPIAPGVVPVPEDRSSHPMPADFAGALDDYAAGARYCPPVDWAAVEDDRIGD